MRQSLSELSLDPGGLNKNPGPLVGTTNAETGPTFPLTAVTAMGIGLLLTVITLIALIIDQTRVHSIADHVGALYAPFDLHPDPNVLFSYLYVTGVFGILLWLTTIWGVSRQKRWARVVASIVFVVATSMALLVLFVSEYGTQIFPTAWGILGILPCIAGLVAVILLWTPHRVGESLQ